MEHSPASNLQVNMNDFPSLLWILKTARQSGRVRVEQQAVDEAQIKVPWCALLLLVDGNVTACYLYGKTDGQRILTDNSAMLWLNSLGKCKLLWSLESSAPKQQRPSGPHTPADQLTSHASIPNGQTGLRATTHPLSDSRPVPPLQARSRTMTNPLAVPCVLPSPQSSSRSSTEPHSEAGLLMDPLEQMGLRTTTSPSSSPDLPPSSQTDPHLVIDPLSDPGLPINYQTGSHATTDSLSEQYLTGSQQTPPPGSLTPVNQQAPSALLTQVPYRIVPVDQEMDTWSRRHRQVFLLIDGAKSVAQIVNILGLPPATVEQIVADLLSWGIVLCI